MANPKDVTTPMEGRVILTRSEAAGLLDVNPATLSAWARRGKIKAIRTPGGQYRYLLEDILPYLQSTSAA